MIKLVDLLNEIPMDDLKQVDQYADQQLDPVDVVLTGRHFFDRLNDPRNRQEISKNELINFFRKLSQRKEEFIEFLKKYKEIVAIDNQSKINIPFMKSANQAIAKTIIRKPGFHTSNKKIKI